MSVCCVACNVHASCCSETPLPFIRIRAWRLTRGFGGNAGGRSGLALDQDNTAKRSDGWKYLDAIANFGYHGFDQALTMYR